LSESIIGLYPSLLDDGKSGGKKLSGTEDNPNNPQQLIDTIIRIKVIIIPIIGEYNSLEINIYKPKGKLKRKK
jgi:hypothetical protein